MGQNNIMGGMSKTHATTMYNNDRARGIMVQPPMGHTQAFDNAPLMGPRPPQGRFNSLHHPHRQASPEPAERPSEFRHEYDMDENGALFFLGSSGRRKMWQNPHGISQVVAFASSIGMGKPEDIVGRAVVNCRTHNEPFSYIGVDLGVGRALVPNVYTIRNRNCSSHVMMNWAFEASNDKVNWVPLDSRQHMTGVREQDAYFEKDQKKLKEKGAASSYSIDTGIYKEIGYDGFRFFRLIQTGKNSSDSDNLALSGFELYGQVTRGRWA